MPSVFLRFFIYLKDQTNSTPIDRLEAVTVEFYERKIDGTDVLLQVGVEGSGVYADSLPVSGATQMFINEDPIKDLVADAVVDTLDAKWKPWAEVWTEYEIVSAQRRRRRKRIEVLRANPQGNFDFYIKVLRQVAGFAAPIEIGRSELFRNCSTLAELSPPTGESRIWIGVPSKGNESFSIGPSSTIEYERVRSRARDVLLDEGGTLDTLSEDALAEVAAQSVAGLDSIGFPPETPAKKLYDPDSNNVRDLKMQGLRLAREADVQQRQTGIEQSTRERMGLVAALQASFACQEWTASAALTGRFHWQVPVDPARWSATDRDTLVPVDVIAIPPGTVRVPAAYFYAISRDFEALVSPLDRYNLAAGVDEKQLRVRFRRAQTRKLIAAAQAPIDNMAADAGPAVDQRGAARRLRGLPKLDLDGRPEPGGEAEALERSYGAVDQLFSDWLGVGKSDEQYWADFTGTATAALKAQHFAIILNSACAGVLNPVAATNFATYLPSHQLWVGVSDIAALKAKTETDWRKAFEDYWGSDIDKRPARDQWQKLLYTVRRLLKTPSGATITPSVSTISFASATPASDALKSFFDGDPNFSFDATSVAIIKALAQPREVIEQLLVLHFLYRVVAQPGSVVPSDLVPRMEALYFRGFLNPWPVARLTVQQFQAALIGTLAYVDAPGIHARATALTTAMPLEYSPPVDNRDQETHAVARVFRPVNHDGLLTDCIPLEHLSPFGPAAYAAVLLKTEAPGVAAPLGDAVAKRRGPLGDLEVTHANTFTPVPVVDLVNEALETLVGKAESDINLHPNGELPADAHPEIFQTTEGAIAEQLTAVPEHSTPSAPAAAAAASLQEAAYGRLREDFSSFERPYNQPLDITRSYLEHIGTSRYQAMRTFRREIHEFVKEPQDTTTPKVFTPYIPPEFDTQTHLRRYPVRLDTAREYLKISEEEHREVFTAPLAESRQKLWQFWGYRSAAGTGHNDTPELPGWSDTVAEVLANPSAMPPPVPRPAGVRRLSAFLRRSGLDYAQFRGLVACAFVPITVLPALPAEEPCDIDGYTIDFTPLDTELALERLAVFLRLWRILHARPHTGYSFEGITNRLLKARRQMQGWPATRVAVTAVEDAVKAFMAPFEAAGAKPIDAADRPAAQAAVNAAFAGLIGAYQLLAPARPLFGDFGVRLEQLSASGNALVTDEIRQLSIRIRASIATADVVGARIKDVENKRANLVADIAAPAVKLVLMEHVRELRVNLADLSDNVLAFAELAAWIARVRDLLPSTGPTLIREARSDAVRILTHLVQIPPVQVAINVAKSDFEAAILGWVPKPDTTLPLERIVELRNILSDALDDHAHALAPFPAPSERTRTLVNRLRRLSGAQAHEEAIKHCEVFLAAFNADALQDEIRKGASRIASKIEVLPPELTAAAAVAQADLGALIGAIDAEPIDGDFAGPLIQIEAMLSWWARQSERDLSFLSTKQICDVLGLYRDQPAPAPAAPINGDFIRQLAAMQMLRDDYALCLTDVLPLWLPASGGVDDARTVQAKSDLAMVIQERADCLRPEPKWPPLLSAHFGEIADLTSLRASGGNDNYPAFLKPTHTQRFVEACFKIARSEFGVTELSFLYLNRHLAEFEDPLRGLTVFEDDPFHVDTVQTALEKQPFADKFSSLTDASLLRLQRLLRGAAYGSILAAQPDGKGSDGKPSWKGIERKKLAEQLGYQELDLVRLDRVFAAELQPDVVWPVPSATNGLIQVWESLAARLKELGYSDLDVLDQLKALLTEDHPKFSAALLTTTRAFEQPFVYDAGSQRLKVEHLLEPSQILAEVTRFKTSAGVSVPACTDDEVKAIRDLYEQPRRTLARFALILPDQREAARRILMPKTAAERMKVFVRYYFIFFRQFLASADHLAAHVLQREPRQQDAQLDRLAATARYLLLSHMEADENWKDNTSAGTYRYPNDPSAKAIAGILGLRGTGIWTEFLSFKQHSGDYVDIFKERFDKYVAKVPNVPAGSAPFQLGNYERLAPPPPPYPDFPRIVDLQPRTSLVREISGSLNYLDHPNDEFGDPLGRETHDWRYNVPKPLRVPEPINHVFALPSPSPGGQKPVELRSGYEVRITDPTDKARNFGGAIPYLVRWVGKLHIATGGEHRFVACFKLPDGEKGPLVPSLISNLTDNTMHLEIFGPAGKLEAVVVPEHRTGASDALEKFGGDKDGIFHTTPATGILPAGHYDIQLSFVDYSVDPSVFEVSSPSGGKDRHVAWIGIFVESKEATPLAGRIAASRKLPKNPPSPPAPPPGGAGDTTFVELLAQSLFISKKEEDDFLPVDSKGAFFYPTPYYFSSIRDIRRSYQRAFKAVLFCHRFALTSDEVAFLLTRGADFRGIAFTRESGTWDSCKLNFDFNQWSVGDAFFPRPETEDIRQYPEAHMPERVWTLFDQWERFHDYVELRARTPVAKAPLWKLFQEATDPVPPTAAGLLDQRLGLSPPIAADALLFTTDASPDLSPINKAALKTEEWPIRIWHSAEWQRARPRLFASAPAAPPIEYRGWAKLAPDVASLRDYINAAYLENGPVRRYANLEQLNAPLREKGRAALVGYLTSLDRCSFPKAAGAAPFARNARDLSERLLLDVETGTCAATPRIEEATAVLRAFVQRLRLGLEGVSPDDISRALLEDWDVRLGEYRRWEAWQYQAAYAENYREAYLIGQAAATEAFEFLEQQLPELSLTADERWDDVAILPAIPGLIRWEDRLPTTTEAMQTLPQGYRKLQRRERSPRRTALSDNRPVNSPTKRESNAMRLSTRTPLEMDSRFVRVQSSTSNFQDDYYFWLVDGVAHDQVAQDASWSWERPTDRNDFMAGIPSDHLAWQTTKTVRLAWCRVRDGIEQEVRISDYGIPLSDGRAELEFVGRRVDLLVWKVSGAAKPDHRFVYDPVKDVAVVLNASWHPPAPVSGGGLPSFPHFIATMPGAAPAPTTFHAPVLLVQKHLRAKDQRDAARQWLEFLHKPLARSNGWLDAEGVAGRPNARVLLLNWLENLLDLSEGQLARNRMATAELSRESLALLRKVLGERPRRIPHRTAIDPAVLARFVPDPAPLNRRLLLIWDRAERFADAIQRCENQRKIRNARTQSALARAPGALPAYGYGQLGDGWMWRSAYDRAELDRDEGLMSPPHYRFAFLLPKALEFCSEARSIASLLMAAFEKGDAEELALLRSRHEVQTNRLLLDVRRSQWREADWHLQALHKAREILELKKQHVEYLIRAGYNSDERSYFNHMAAAEAFTLGTEIVETLAQTLLSVPEVYVGVCSMVKFVSGQKLSAGAKIASSILHMFATVNSMDASVDATHGSFDRREEEWRHQVEVLTIELEQVRRQILAADRRRDIALRELNIHQDSILNAQEVQSFQQNKFSNAEHQLWVQDRLAGLYRGMFDVAMAAAEDAENAFRYERHYAPADFLSDVVWSGHREGMTAGEQMLMALRRMEQAYLQQNVREHELSRSISLRLNLPEALVALRLTGSCELSLPEWMFDLELPGHYRRRIKNVAISVLCATGPYQTVNARLTLLSDATRLSPNVHPEYDEQVSLAGDPRFVRRYAAHQSIVTTSAQNDTGLFETNLRDERYLPFEGAGIISRWRVEIDPAANQFDPESLTDVVLHFRYTAVDGGLDLRAHAHAAARRKLPGPGTSALRYLDMQHDLPAQWVSLREGKLEKFSLDVVRDMFPWSRNSDDLVIEGLDVFLKPAPGQPLPPKLNVRARGQGFELLLVDRAYGEVYHGRVTLAPAVVQAGLESVAVQLDISAPEGFAVPRPEILLVPLRYFYAAREQVIPPCDRFSPIVTA